MKDEAAANTGPQGDHADAFGLASCANPLFTQGSAIGVVFQDDWCSQPVLNLGLDRRIVPSRQVRGGTNSATLNIDDAGDANASANDLLRTIRQNYSTTETSWIYQMSRLLNAWDAVVLHTRFATIDDFILVLLTTTLVLAVLAPVVRRLAV